MSALAAIISPARGRTTSGVQFRLLSVSAVAQKMAERSLMFKTDVQDLSRATKHPCISCL